MVCYGICLQIFIGKFVGEHSNTFSNIVVLYMIQRCKYLSILEGPTVKLDFSSGAKPLWSQLAHIIKNKIECGEYKVGDILPSEMSLVEEFQISRITVRQALDRLMAEGYITRQRGKGTIVKSCGNNLSTRMQSSFKQLEEKNNKAIKKLVEVKLVKAPEEVAEFFQLENDEMVIMLKRINEVDGRILTVFNTYISPKIPITLKDDFHGSFYKLLELKGYVVTSVKEVISACISTDEDKETFLVNEDKAIITRKKYGYSGNLTVELTYCRYIADEYNLVIELA